MLLTNSNDLAIVCKKGHMRPTSVLLPTVDQLKPFGECAVSCNNMFRSQCFSLSALSHGKEGGGRASRTCQWLYIIFSRIGRISFVRSQRKCTLFIRGDLLLRSFFQRLKRL